MSSFVYVALDHETHRKNLNFAKKLLDVESENFGFKINLSSLLDLSSSSSAKKYVQTVQGLGKPVFLDLKMWYGRGTMEKIAETAANLNVDMINLYAHVGKGLMASVKNVLDGSNTKLFALTMLTHYSHKEVWEIYARNLGDVVRDLSLLAQEAGVDGIILPPTTLNCVGDVNLLKMCPGIRPNWYQDKDGQAQVMTPRQARRADYIVVGAPIYDSKDPKEALERILGEIM